VLFIYWPDLATNFIVEAGVQALDRSSPDSSSTPITRRVIYNRVHNLLSHLLGLIPTLPLALQPVITSHFPHKKLSKLAQTTYIRNLLTLSGYCPALSDAILSLIVERAQQIDVSTSCFEVFLFY
jgi:RNA polymerase I-specific transcription initiation factor RRN3